MTERERIEKEILLDIVLESSRRIAGPDTEDPIRTEVTERLRRLCGDTPARDGGSVRERGLTRARDRSNEGKGCIRFPVNGKRMYVPEFMLEKVPWPASPLGYKRVLKAGYSVDDILAARKQMAGEGLDNAKEES